MTPMLLLSMIFTQELLQEDIQILKSKKEIPVLRGVRQGDPVSPKLFTAIIQ